jgi:hypothetical protein
MMNGTPIAKDGWMFPGRQPQRAPRSGATGTQGASAAMGAQGKTYYPVNPLGPHSGPTAAQFPNGQLPSGQAAPAPAAPGAGLSSGLSSVVDALNSRMGGNYGNTWLQQLQSRWPQWPGLGG